MIKRMKSYPVTLGVLWVLILLGLSFVYAMFQGGFVSWFIFYSFLPVMIYTLIIAIYPLNRIQITRELNKDILHAGETLRVTITLSRKWPFPLFYLVVEDRLPNRLENKYLRFYPDKPIISKGLFSFGFKRVQTFPYEIPNIPRGHFKLGKITIQTGDLFGFIQKQSATLIDQQITIYPKVADLPHWLPLMQSEGGHHRSRKSFEYDLSSVSSVRDYIPGDRLSWLDWKATARSAKLVTKQFEYPLNRDVLVILDQASSSRQKGADLAFEHAVSLSASLAKQALKTGSSVGFFSLGKDVKAFPMDNNDVQQWLILSHLSQIETNGEIDSGNKIKSVLNSYTKHPAVAFVTTQVNDVLLANLQEFLFRGLSIELFYVKQMEEVDQKINQKLQQLSMSGVRVQLIKNNAFNDQIKAGGYRATS